MSGPLRLLIVLALLALRPAPLGAAPVSMDLDGDGQPEEVLLGDEVVVRRGGSILGRLSLAGLEGVRIQEAPAPYLVLRGQRPGGEALLVAALHAGHLEEVHRGSIGPLGRDGEFSVEVEVGPEIVRYQTAPGVTRCDGEKRLFAQSYRPGAGWRRLELPVPAGPRLVPRTAPPKGLPAIPLPVYRAAAASEQAGVERADLLAPPRELEDGRRETAWRVTGEGRGAWITLRAAPGHSVRGLLVVPATGAGAPRPPQTMAAVFADGKSVRFDLVRTGPHWIELPQPVPGPCVSLVVLAGAPGGPTGLGEVAAYSELDGQDVRTLGGMVAAADAAAADAVRVLEHLLPGQAQTVLQAVEAALPGASGVGRWRLQRLLVSVVQTLDESGRQRLGPTAAVLLQRALAEGEDVQRPPLWAALSTLPGAEQAMVALAADPAQRPAVRAEALGRLGQHGAALALLRLQAEGLPDAVRPSLVEGLTAALRCLPAGDPRSAAAGAALAAAARRRPTAVNEAADLADAIGRARSGCPEAEARLAETLVEAWQALGQEDAFVARYRLLQALGPVGQVTAPVVDLLRTVLQGEREPVLRRAAAQTAAMLPGDAMASLVRLGLRDEDAGVRMAALAAVAERHDASAQAEVEQILAADAWPQVRRAAAEARAAVCPAPSTAGAAGLARSDPLRAALDDPDPEVQRVALAGVARCEGTSAAPLLARVARSISRRPALRGQACALLARIQGPAASPVLADVVREAVDQAGEDEERVKLASTCLRALGRAGGPAALPAVVSVLGDNAAVDAVALEQVALLCRSGVPSRLRRTLTERIAAARSRPDRHLSKAAENAARHCESGR